MATLVLFSWPIVVLALFGALGPIRGMIWATMIGYLFLPEVINFNLSVLPPYNKTSAISLSLLLGVLAFRRRLPAIPSEVGDPLFRRMMLFLLISSKEMRFLEAL